MQNTGPGVWGRYEKDGTAAGPFCKLHMQACQAWLCEGLNPEQVAQKIKEKDDTVTKEMRTATRILKGQPKPFNDESVQSAVRVGFKLRAQVAVVFEDDWHKKMDMSLDVDGLPVVSNLVGFTGDNDNLLRMLVLDPEDQDSFPADLVWHKGELFATVENCHFEIRMSHQQQLRSSQGRKTLQQRGLNDFISRGSSLSVEGLRNLKTWAQIETLKDQHVKKLEEERAKLEGLSGNQPLDHNEDDDEESEDDIQARVLGTSVGAVPVKKKMKKKKAAAATPKPKAGRSKTPARRPRESMPDGSPRASPSPSPGAGQSSRVDISPAPDSAVWQTISPQAILSGVETVEKRLNGSYPTFDS